jgi:hypothetical protein
MVRHAEYGILVLLSDLISEDRGFYKTAYNG